MPSSFPPLPPLLCLWFWASFFLHSNISEEGLRGRMVARTLGGRPGVRGAFAPHAVCFCTRVETFSNLTATRCPASPGCPWEVPASYAVDVLLWFDTRMSLRRRNPSFSGHTYRVAVCLSGVSRLAPRKRWDLVVFATLVFAAGALLGWVSMPNAAVPNLTSRQGLGPDSLGRLTPISVKATQYRSSYICTFPKLPSVVAEMVLPLRAPQFVLAHVS